MEISITTPSLLFPAISLLMLAYTNRFITLAGVIRHLNSPETSGSGIIVRQIENLSKRLRIIRAMQIFGVLSFLVCTLAMFALFLGWIFAGKVLFGASLLLLLCSLIFSLWEVHISTLAIDLEIARYRGKIS